MKSNFTLILGFLAGTILPVSPGQTHVADPSGADRKSEVIFVTPAVLEEMNLPEHPEKAARFDVQLGDNPNVTSCRIRFADQESALAKAGCNLIRKRVDWEPPRNRKGEIRKRPTKIWLDWPAPNAEPQLSSFGGALPVSLGAWDRKIEFAPLRRYRVLQREFVVVLNISDKGVATDCTLEPDTLPQDLGKTICTQFLDHSRWIPAVSEDGGSKATVARLVSEIEIDSGDCLEGVGLQYRQKTGVLRWTIATGNDGCRFDVEQFGFPTR